MLHCGRWFMGPVLCLDTITKIGSRIEDTFASLGWTASERSDMSDERLEQYGWVISDAE